MLINCDIGERGADNGTDRKLMEAVHIANLACGGHAGDAQSVNAFREPARRHGVRLAAHLSYPDRENFGRGTMRMTARALLASLEEQLGLLPDADLVKFHGALYNESCADKKIAMLLAGWLARKGIREVIAPGDSELAAEAQKRGIAVLREAFAERAYEWDTKGKRLRLAPRSRPGACLTDVPAALAQAEEIIRRGRVNVSGKKGGPPVWKKIAADTICVHSDSPIALELAEKLRGLIQGYRLLKPGVCAMAGLPVYGRQDLGVTPGGAMDCFSLRLGNALLGKPEGAEALEILAAPEIEILADGSFAVTGGVRDALIHGAGAREAAYGLAHRVKSGERVTFGELKGGLRSYFSFRAGTGKGKPLPRTAPWMDAEGRIRVLRGPEYGRLENPGQFFRTRWRTTFRMDRMGMRLAGEPKLKCVPAGIISEAVADGTIQLAPEGPIILLRHRQTVGGYPRIFNVISADVDLLGQLGPDRAVSFVEVGMVMARAAARAKERTLRA